MPSRLSKLAALAAFVALAMTLASPAAKAADEAHRTLTVTGTGEASAPPDIASIQIGVVNQGDTARAALDANTAAMEKVMALFADLGIAGKDLRTSGFSVQPRYFHDPKGEVAPRVTGYEVSNTVHVVVRQLGELGRVLDRAVSEGSNTIQSLDFSVAKPEALRDEARRQAGADAKRKAAIYAESLGIELGDIIEISEIGGTPQPVPYMMRATANAELAVPIAAGEQVLSVDVSVRWEIK